jgi:hypothetical protein
VGKKNWRANELAKKKRLTRHLQYELTVAEQMKEKRDWENTVHRADQMIGIEDYENNLMRNGLGGDDTAAPGGGEVLLPTTENSESYLNRIEEKVQTHWPTNGEISDFMQTLEKRTRELRLARQEKARRKRRLQVEQKAALLVIGGSSAPPSRSNSLDASSLMGTERPDEKAARKKREYDELTQKAAVQRALQADEGEKQVQIFAERQRMMAFENNDWETKREAVLAAQASRAVEKKARNRATCKAIVLELITDLFPADASQPVGATSSQDAEAREDDIHHTLLINELSEICQRHGDDGELLTHSRVSRSPVADLYPSVALLASDIARWKRVDGNEAAEGSISFGRVSSFRESALEIFQQLQIYSESTSITPFTLSLSAEYLPLLNSLTLRFQESKTCPHQSVYLVAGGAHNLSAEVLTTTCDWLGGPDLFALLTVSTAIQLAVKLRQSVVAADGTADPSLVRFENLFNLWDIRSAVDSTLFPEISFHASRIVGDLFDILTRLSATAEGGAIELSSFRFSDTTLAILLAQILWLREYVCFAVHAINGTTPLTPIVLVSFHFGAPDRVVALRVFDWFLRGGSRVSLPEGDDEIGGEINAEIATVPVEKGKKAAKPPGKGKKDKRDTTELIQHTSPIKGIVWLQGRDVVLNEDSVTSSSSLDLPETARLYAELVKKKAILDASQQSAEAVERNKATAELFAKQLKAPLVWLGLGSLFTLSHPFNAIEAIAAIVLKSLPMISPPTPQKDPSGTAAPPPSDDPLLLTEEILSSLTSRRELLLSTPQRIWLNHVMQVHVINLEAIRGVLTNMREGVAKEADGLAGVILTLLLRMQQIRSEMLCEKAVQSNLFKLSEGKWKETCLEWRESLLQMSSSRRPLSSKSDPVTDLQMRSRELECELGDLIDLRHQQWTKLLEKLSDRLLALLRVLSETLATLVVGLQRTIAPLVKRNLADSLQLTALLAEAGYRAFPWALKADLKKGGAVRVEGNRLKDEVRNQIGQLLSGLNRLLPTTTSPSEPMTSLASELLAQLDRLPPIPAPAMEAAETDESLLKAAVIHEIKTEGYELLVTLFRTLSECLNSMTALSRTVLVDLNDYSFQRNQYEHRLLREWITELRGSFSTPVSEVGGTSSSPYVSAIAFMNSYYYGVSDDPEHDGVPRSSLSNHGLVDMGEMVLPIGKIRLLSLELFLERASASSAMETFDPFEFLTAAIQRLFESSESLPLVWRQINKLHHLVEAICESHPAAAHSSEQFSVELVMRLIYAALPLSIPSSFIVKIGQKICEGTLCSLSPQSPCVVKLSTVLTLLEKDKGLSQGWWPSHSSGGSSQHHRDLVHFVIEAIALTAAIPETALLLEKTGMSTGKQTIESVDVQLDKLLLALCYGPSLSNEPLTALQRSLCLSYDSTSIGETTHHPPQFLYESMTKLLSVGLYLIKHPQETETEQEGEAEQSGGELSLYETVYGPTIPSPSTLLAWLDSLHQLPPHLLDSQQSSLEPILCKEVLDTLRQGVEKGQAETHHYP